MTDPSSSSCGAPAGHYPNLQWALDPATGALTSPMDGKALQYDAKAGTLGMVPFTGAPGQVRSGEGARV